MSAFDDEFGLFGDEPGEEEERRSTLGARVIASSETIIDEIEPEDDAPRRRRGPRTGEKREFTPQPPGSGPPMRRRPPRPLVQRPALPDEIALPRAVELLTFLAKRLVAKPDDVRVEVLSDPKGPVLELEVDPDDLGKVIGRGGRVAQAMRTLVRAAAEGRVTVEIVDVEDDEDDEDDAPEAAGTEASASAHGEREATDLDDAE